MIWQRRLMPVALMFTPSGDRKRKFISETIARQWHPEATMRIAGREPTSAVAATLRTVPSRSFDRNRFDDKERYVISSSQPTGPVNHVGINKID